MRRNWYSFVLSLLAGIAVLLSVSMASSSAAPSAYPPKPGRTLSVNTTTPAAGEIITISGTGWGPGVTVTITLHSKVVTLATDTTGSSGSFAVSARVPTNFTGHHTLIASAPGGVTLTVVLSIGAESTGKPAPGKGSGGLPFTGADVYGLIGIAVLFLLVGGTLMLTNRRRRAMSA